MGITQEGQLGSWSPAPLSHGALIVPFTPGRNQGLVFEQSHEGRDLIPDARRSSHDVLMDDQGKALDSRDVVPASLGQMVSFIHNSFSFCVKPADVDTLWLHKTRCKRVIICKALQVLWVKGNVVIAKQCY